MTRLCLCLLIALCSVTSAAAREVKLSDAGGPSCQESHDSTGKHAAANPTVPAAAPSGETKAKPALHSDSASSSGLQSPRWHSFLPGMFR